MHLTITSVFMIVRNSLYGVTSIDWFGSAFQQYIVREQLPFESGILFTVIYKALTLDKVSM